MQAVPQTACHVVTLREPMQLFDHMPMQLMNGATECTAWYQASQHFSSSFIDSKAIRDRVSAATILCQ